MSETFEIICEECSKAFESIDEEATLCPDCWARIISLEGEGLGEDAAEKE